MGADRPRTGIASRGVGWVGFFAPSRGRRTLRGSRGPTPADATREGDAEQYAADETRRGAITSVEAVDARRANTPVRGVVRVTPPDVPVYALRVKYEKEAGTFLLAPVFHLNGRWAWMPNLEQMADTFQEPDAGAKP